MLMEVGMIEENLRGVKLYWNKCSGNGLERRWNVIKVKNMVL